MADFMKVTIILTAILALFYINISYSKSPKSQRAIQVIAKQTPLLKQAFTQQKLAWGSPIFIRIFKQF